MTAKTLTRVLAGGLGLALSFTTVSAGDLCPTNSFGRVSASEKGSLLIWPKVELRWDSGGNLIQDTIIELSNDFPGSVDFQMFFVNGDAPLDESGVRFHPGWNFVDVRIFLTANQPTYWSAATGQPATGGVSPFTILDPGSPPGRPDPDGSGDRVLRGFIVGWAVRVSDNHQIRFNHLKGSATIINYLASAAWEYNAYAARVNPNLVSHGSIVGTGGVLLLDGSQYAAGYDFLLYDFFATGSQALSGGMATVTSDTDVTLMPITADLRLSVSPDPVTTKAEMEIWNMNEVKFSGAQRCLTCWDQALLSNYGDPDHFDLNNLQTNKGRARVNGVSDPGCFASSLLPAPFAGDPSEYASLLGVVAKVLDVNGSDTALAGTNMVGTGEECAEIIYDVGGVIPEDNDNGVRLRPDRFSVGGPVGVSNLSVVGEEIPEE